MSIILRVCGVVLVSHACGGAAVAQSAVLIEVDEPELRPGQSTAVTMWAAWPDGDYAMCCVVTDLLASMGAAGWSDVEIVSPMDGPGATIGDATVAGFEGITAAQLNFPPTGGPSGDNPIAFWRASYTAPHDVGSPYDLELSTRTSRFDVYIGPDDPLGHSRLDGLTEGSATIRVVPAPAGVLALGLGLAVHSFRRRR